MSKKKKAKKQDNAVEQDEVKVDAEKNATSDKESKQESKETKVDEVEEWKSKYDEINDRYLRLYSEFDNYRKRTLKEKLEMAKAASEELIVELLTILDDFERAIKSTEEIKDCEPVKEGTVLIYNKLSGLLSKKGVKPIDSIGKDFDTDFHEAITYIPATSDEMKGKIIDEIEKGYLLHDKVIRYTKVVIGQ